MVLSLLRLDSHLMKFLFLSGKCSSFPVRKHCHCAQYMEFFSKMQIASLLCKKYSSIFLKYHNTADELSDVSAIRTKKKLNCIIVLYISYHSCVILFDKDDATMLWYKTMMQRHVLARSCTYIYTLHHLHSFSSH